MEKFYWLRFDGDDWIRKNREELDRFIRTYYPESGRLTHHKRRILALNDRRIVEAMLQAGISYSDMGGAS